MEDANSPEPEPVTPTRKSGDIAAPEHVLQKGVSLCLKSVVLVLSLVSYSWYVASSAGTVEMELVGENSWKGFKCFVVLRELPRLGISSQDSIQVGSIDVGSQADGPCGTASHDAFRACFGKAQVSGGTAECPVWESAQYQTATLKWHSGGASTGLYDNASTGLIAFICVLASGFIFLRMDMACDTWVSRASEDNRCSKFIVIFVVWMISTVYPYFTVSVIANMRTYGSDELKGAAEIHLSNLQYGMLSSMICSCFWLGVATMVRRCFKDKKFGPKGWCLMWSFPFLMAVMTAMSILAGITLPNFLLAFSLNINFPLAIMVDMIQLVLFVCGVGDSMGTFMMVYKFIKKQSRADENGPAGNESTEPRRPEPNV